MIKKIKKFFKTIEENKFIATALVYSLWIGFQIIMLLFYAGFQGLFYVSLKFSLIIFVLLFFILLISFPTFFLFMIWVFFIWIINFWNFWIFGKILIWFYFFFLFFWRFILKKWFPKKFKSIQKSLKKSKFDSFSWHYLILMFIMVILSMWYAVFWKKVVQIQTQKNQVIMWELNFYNQEYYFLDVCWNKFILPSTEVASVKLLWDQWYFSQNKGKLSELNTTYNNYCTQNKNSK